MVSWRQRTFCPELWPLADHHSVSNNHGDDHDNNHGDDADDDADNDDEDSKDDHDGIEPIDIA